MRAPDLRAMLPPILQRPEARNQQGTPPTISAGTLTLYQFYDVGYAIDLDHAQACLPEAPARRDQPVQARQASSIKIAQPPLHLPIGTTPVRLSSYSFDGTLRASMYELGTIALAITLTLPGETRWSQIAELLSAWQTPPAELVERFHEALEQLEQRIRPAIIRPAPGAIVEDYSILIVERLTQDATVDLLDHPVVYAALMGEQRPLSPSTSSQLMSLSYCIDDLALLSWNGALLADPEPLATETAAALIEFANVELLQMRLYDADIDRELPRVYQRMSAARRRFTLPLVRRYSDLLHDLQQLVVEITEVTERVDNALKVTDDVYWNRLYSATLSVLRVQVWRAGVEQKLAILRETYSMLYGDAEAERAIVLEWIVIVLILVEILAALLNHH